MLEVLPCACSALRGNASTRSALRDNARTRSALRDNASTRSILMFCAADTPVFGSSSGFITVEYCCTGTQVFEGSALRVLLITRILGV